LERVLRDSDITLASRFECKYVVSALLVPAIREFVQPFVRPDRFAARHGDGRYPICSLYLDSDDLRLYQQTVSGEKNRFKLRVRSYSDDESAPLFFEVKRKVNSIVQKRRARVKRVASADLLDRSLEQLRQVNDPDLEHFVSHMDLTAARPVVRVRYLREAYESIAGDPVRITLDTELMHVCTFDFDTSHASGRWVTTPIDGVILEIKFTEMFPSWVRDLVRAFDLKQQPVPKYVLSVDHLLLVGRETVVSIGGMTLPPRRA
jgi:SPX domain protein involved in polyphosphate accumulation